MRLIDADDLKNALNTELKSHLLYLPIDFKELIDNAPTVTGIISAKDFKKRINNMQYIYLQSCAEDVIDAIDCEVTYFKEKQSNG